MLQPNELEAADNTAARGRREYERIAGDYPDGADDGDREEVVHQHVEHVLCPHHAAIKERQSRCHEEHQRGAHQHPRRIAGIDLAHQSTSSYRCRYSDLPASVGISRALPVVYGALQRLPMESVRLPKASG